MRFLIHSNGPNTKTGYGVQCAQLAERLHDAGHEVAVSATFGQQGSTGSWKPEKPRNPEGWDKGIRVYQTGWQLNGIDIVHNHASHWFGENKLDGWLILLGDVWSLLGNPLLADFNVAAWTPVDHFPCPPGVVRFFEDSGALPVAMSRFGEHAFKRAGLDPVYVPLTVDLERYKPTPTVDHPEHGTIPGRSLLGVPDEAFLVGMVAMNKDPDDRKGFNEAFAAFGAFRREHPDAVLYVHSDRAGMGTSFSLDELAGAHGIPEHSIRFPDIYGYQMGWSAEMMAAAYTAFDVLLAPSHGEGFCVPLIEAQACGTPVIASNFTAQPELIGAGWAVRGQQLWDVAHKAFYMVPFIDSIIDALNEAYTADLDELEPKAIEKAAEYDTDLVYEELWAPLIAQMVADPVQPELDRDEPFEVDIIVPAMRPENIKRLVDSFTGTARIHLVTDDGFDEGPSRSQCDSLIRTGKEHTTYAEKVNLGFAQTTAPWVFLCGDDVEFHPGWLEEASKLADRYDIIGTNDSLPGRTRHPDIATGNHADHFFVRRSYVEKYGASLDGPGSLAPECYGHWYVDREMLELAKARNTFTPCLTSIVEHHHPGYDQLPRDQVYMRAIEHSEADEATFESRRPLIEMQRTTRGRR